MTIDFSDDKSNTPGEKDLTNPGGVSFTDDNGTADDAVVFEHGGRKYTKADLAKKLDSADTFIETLKTERQQDRELLEKARESLEKSLTSAELLAKIKEAGEGGERKDTPTPVLADAVAARVLAQLKQEQSAASAEANWRETVAVLKEAYGEHANAKVKEIAGENGLSLEEAQELARTKPALFRSIFITPKKPQGSSLHFGRGNSVTQPAPKPESSGYWEAKNTREQVSSYLQRLAEIGSR